MEYTKLKENGDEWRYFLQPLTSIHLKSNFTREIESNGNNQNTIILIVTGVLVLAIALMNFINLTIAAGFSRSREVGVKKTLGLGKYSLGMQFLQESAITVFMAVILSLGCVILLSGSFSSYISRHVFIRDYWSIGLFLTGLFFVITLIGGGYPALFLARLSVLRALGGVIKISKSDINFKNILVVIQFTISTSLIIGVIIVYKQLSYMQKMTLGFEKEEAIIIEDPSRRLIRKKDVLASY
ncbi:FtsX-like permease family protein [Fulvivirga sp. M361]|uniref:ABC transporter permease n=1 Tax=Fulvivirga sp. M361 TaxID=2594266 RepID=UPI001179BF3D|nr:FtsX-like permease family protein [Fulvivirga sp. M361]TRX52057.1 FtsX-like permease family protein [Fulvivirga sp. M361]